MVVGGLGGGNEGKLADGWAEKGACTQEEGGWESGHKGLGNLH